MPVLSLDSSMTVEALHAARVSRSARLTRASASRGSCGIVEARRGEARRGEAAGAHKQRAGEGARIGREGGRAHRHSQRAGLSLRARFTGRSFVPGLARRARWTSVSGLTGRARLARLAVGTGLALRPDLARVAGAAFRTGCSRCARRASLARVARRTHEAVEALRARRTHLAVAPGLSVCAYNAGWAEGALLPGWAGSAVLALQPRQAKMAILAVLPVLACKPLHWSMRAAGRSAPSGSEMRFRV